MTTVKENIPGCFRTLDGANGHVTPSSAAITSRKRGLNIIEVIAAAPESFMETLRFIRARARNRMDLRLFRQNQGMIQPE